MSFALSLPLLDNLMLMQRPRQSQTDYVHFMRHTLDDYNETCELVYGSAAIHPHKQGMPMKRGISSTGPFDHAKQCVVNAFDTNYLMSADEVMVSILHLAHNMDEGVAAPGLPPMTLPPLPSPRLALLVAVRTTDAGKTPVALVAAVAYLTKFSACGSTNHILSSCTTSDDALLKWTLAKRKMIVQKYGTPTGSSSAHTALLSDGPLVDPDTMPTLEDCTDEFDDCEVRVPFTSVAFSSFIAPGRDLSQF
jgi:hypothetical protein